MKKLFIPVVICMLSIQTLTAENQTYSEQEKIKKINYAQTIFRKKLQRKCGYTAGHWAQQHTKQEWTNIQNSGNFKNELATMCPKGAKVTKTKWLEPLYLFAVEYAKDSNTRPRC